MTRIYEVSSKDEFHLVEANSQSQALRFIANNIYTVKVADQHTLVGAMKGGHQIQDATAAAPVVESELAEEKK